MIARFAFKAQIAKDIYSFYFKPEKPFRYIAGQYIELAIASAKHPDNRRWFTLSSSPTEDLLTITTKIDPKDTSSFKDLLLALYPEEQVIISEAMGDFILPMDTNLPLIFVAGGIGITPYRSMLQWLHENHEDRKITLFYGGKQQDSMPFLAWLQERLPNTILVTGGHIDANHIVAAATIDSVTYVSGPEGMVTSLSKELKRLLPRSSQIVTDAFLGYN
jgi:ferredoxin-NADP reductase